MTGRCVYLLPTGSANSASVRAALVRLGARVQPASAAEQLTGDDPVVLPGVGTPAAALTALERAGLRQPLAERLRSGRPTLAICLGLQLLAERSDESPDIAALGLLPARVRRLPPTVRTPQLGWNRVDSDGWLASGYAYYANSYCLDEPALRRARADGFSVAWSELGGGDQRVRFVAALARGPLLACQFHPELSGRFGAELIARWLAGELPVASDAAAEGRRSVAEGGAR